MSFRHLFAPAFPTASSRYCSPALAESFSGSAVVSTNAIALIFLLYRLYSNKEFDPVKFSSRRTVPIFAFVLLILLGLQAPALAATRNVITNCGATGNGSVDDTAAIKTCIGQLQSGDTLLFPAGMYQVSSQLTINLSNITIDGSNNTATILNTATGNGAIGMLIGRNGIGNTNAALASAVALSATANELDTAFTTVSSLGASAGSYVYLQQGGTDTSGGGNNSSCDPSGCRGEVVKIASVSGNTYTVTTALHDTYSPAVNGATAQLVNGMLSGITIQNITFDGNGGANSGVTYGLMVNDVADSTISGVTSQNVQGAAIVSSVSFNTSWSNINVTHAGSAACGGAVSINLAEGPIINTMNLSSLNPGAPNSGCLNNGAFGFEFLGAVTLANVTGLTVDSAGTGGGRPMKITSTRYGTFNSTTVKNGCCAYNGLSLEYYSSHNTFNNCVIQNNGGSGTGNGNAGINSFGNFNQFNTFNSCTISGNGNEQILVNNFDALHLGADSNVAITGSTISGPGVGISINASNGCISNNTFVAGSGLSTGISVMNTTTVGTGNTLNGFSSNLPSGTCQSGSTSTPPAPPTGLTAVVQ